MRSMLLPLMLITAVLLTVSSNAQCLDKDSVYTFYIQTVKYDLVQERMSWEQAAACAASEGGHLVHINSSIEQDSLWLAIQNAGISPSYTSVFDGGGVAYIYIGATDKASEGTWLWDGEDSGSGENFWNGEGDAGAGNGSSVGGAYINWGGSSTGIPNEPDDYNNNQDAAAIALAPWPAGVGSLGISGEWNDINALNQLYFIIEYPNSTGIRYDGFNANFQINPNPVQTELTFHYPSGQFMHIQILNVLAQKMYNKSVTDSNEGKLVINVSDWEHGVYILQARVSDKQGREYRIVRTFQKY